MRKAEDFLISFETSEYAEKDGKKAWYYVLEGKPTMYAKDQLFCRKSCMPEDLFNVK